MDSKIINNKDYLQLFKNYLLKFNKLNNKIKTILITSFIIIFILFIIIIYWTFNIKYKILFNELNDDEISKIVKILEDEKIKFKIENNDILVPEKLFVKAKIKLASSGLNLGSGVGFELFDKTNFGMSEEERKINYQRALQTELERTINKIPGIEKSRIHLMIADDKLFEDEEISSKASVYLKIKNNYQITEQQIQGIQSLISNSINNLKPENVIVLSTDGKILSNNFIKDDYGFENNLIKIKNIEEYYRKKIQSFLDNILGVNNSTVRVSVNLQLYKTEINKEIYKPNISQPAIKNEIISNETSGIGNDEKIISNNNISTNNQIVKQNKQINYEIDKEYQKIIMQPGEIKNIFVAIVLNGKYSEDYIKQIKESVIVGNGLNLKRGDMIDIKALEFKKIENPLEEKNNNFIKYEIFNFMKEYLPLFFIMLLAFLMYLNTNNIIKNFKAVKVSPNNNGKEKLDEELILKIAKENPAEAAKIIKTWL